MRMVLGRERTKYRDFSNWRLCAKRWKKPQEKDWLNAELLFQYAVLQFLFTPVSGRLNESQNHGMRLLLRR